MMNTLGKTLVLIHAVLCFMGMTWAIMLVLQARDFGWMAPFREVLEWTPEGNVKSAILHASEYDKSQAALTEAAKTRDRTYVHVKPAIDSIRASEPYLPNNTLFYKAELERLRSSQEPIEVRRLKAAGIILDTPGSRLGKPVPEDKALEMVTKSFVVYQGDLKKIFAEIDKVEEEIQKVVATTKKITAELAGPDETFKYKGLYHLLDKEFEAQGKLKVEIDDIKPNWSKAVEQSRLFLQRRAGLEATLEKLKGPVPKKKEL